MLVFIVPLKSPQTSKSWYNVCNLVERTLRSLCNQTVSDFRVVVVCHQKPSIDFSHPYITYLEVDFPIPNSVNYASRNTDKGRKILYGLIYASQFNPTHTMVVDADDVVNRNLAKFVKDYPQSNGWYINRGYKYLESNDHLFIYLKRSNFYKMCGSCNILRYDLNFLPKNPHYNCYYSYYKYYIDHAKVKKILEEKGVPIKPLPFLGAVYIINHGDNNINNYKRLSFNWINRRHLTNNIQQEFGLYRIDLSEN